MMMPGQNGGSGATPGFSDPRVMASASRLLSQANQGTPQAAGTSGTDVDALRQQMQASRAVGQNYAQQQTAQAGAGGGGADYGQAQAAQFAAQMQAFRQAQLQRMQFFSRVSRMDPQAAGRAYMLQAMDQAGQDTDGMQALWGMQDQVGGGGQ